MAYELQIATAQGRGLGSLDAVIADYAARGLGRPIVADWEAGLLGSDPSALAYGLTVHSTEAAPESAGLTLSERHTGFQFDSSGQFGVNTNTGAYIRPYWWDALTIHEQHLLLDANPELQSFATQPWDYEDPIQHTQARGDIDYLFGFLPSGTLAALVSGGTKVATVGLSSGIEGALLSVGGSMAGGAAGAEVGGALGGPTGELVGGAVGGAVGGYAGATAGNAYFPAPSADLGTIAGGAGDDALAGGVGADMIESVVDPVYFGFDQPLNPGASGWEPYQLSTDLVAGNPAPAFIPALDYTPLQAGDLMHHANPGASSWTPSWSDAGAALAVGKAGLGLAQALDGSGGKAGATARPVAYRPAENPGSLGGWYDAGSVSPDPVAALAPGPDPGGSGLLLGAVALGAILYTLLAR